MAFNNMSCFLLATLLCSALFVTYVASDKVGKRDNHTIIVEECMKEIGFEGKGPIEAHFPHAETMACVMQRTGEITPEGKFSLERKIEMISSFLKDEAVRAYAVEAITKCAEEINSGEKTPEEIAEAVIKCMDDTGVPHPEHIRHQHQHEKSDSDE